MELPFPSSDPKSNLVEFKREKRVGSITPVPRSYGSCRHDQTIVDEANRAVTCSKCGALLDAFTVLYEMAKKQRRWLDELDQWDAYRESKLSDRYDEKWARNSQDITSPPIDPETRKVWDVFDKYWGEKFCGMYKLKARKQNGPQWYGKSIHGGCASFEYVRNQLITKVG